MQFLTATTLFICFIFSNVSIAAQNVALTHSDASIKEFQRKVVFINPEIGYESEVSASVKYCPLKGDCYSRDPWTFTLSNGLIATNAGNFAKNVGLNRFDALTLTERGITITAPYGTVELDSGGIIPSGGVMSYEMFRSSFEKVLANRASGIAKALANAVDLRAKSLRDKEAGTTMTGRMKSTGLDDATLKNMMDDGFAFANYVSASAAVTISEVEYTDTKTHAVTIEYSVNVATTVTTQMLAYHFDANTKTFSAYKNWTGASGLPWPASTYSARPTKSSDIKDLFETSYSANYKDAVLKLPIQVMRDDNFSMQTKITEVDWNDFKSNLHAGLGLRVDSLWKVNRSIDGNKNQVALGKTRQVAPAPKAGEEAYSNFANIKGNAEQGDQLSEFPTTGVKGNIGLGSIAFKLKEIGTESWVLTSAEPDQSFVGLKAGYATDIGYNLNSESLSEVWASFDLALARGSAFELGAIKMDAPTFAYIDFGLEKTTYIGSSGFSLSPAVRLAFSRLNASGKDAISGNAYDLSLSEVTIKPGIALSYTLNSFNEFRLSMEYPVQLSNHGTLENKGTSIEDTLSKNIFGQGRTVFLSYRWNRD